MSRCARSLPLAAMVVALCLRTLRRRRAAGHRRAGRAVALRPRAQGLRRHRAQPTLEGLVHGRRRRAERRLLPDQRQHQQRDAAVRRHRRLDVHRPADARHDLHGPGARRPRADLPRHRHGQERALQDRHRLHDRLRRARPCSSARSFVALQGQDVATTSLYVRFDPTLNGNGGGGDRQRRRRQRRLAQRRRPHAARRLGHRHRRPTPPTATTRSPVFSALDAAAASTRSSNGYAGAASDGLKQLDARHALTATSTTAPTTATSSRPAQVDLGHDGTFTLALGFGDDPGRAPSSATPALAAAPASATRAAPTERGWHRYDARPRRAAAPARRLAATTGSDLLDEYYLSANYVKAAEDKTFPGAVAAALPRRGARRSPPATRPTPTSAPTARSSRRDLYEAWTAAVPGRRPRGRRRDMTALPVRAPAAARRLDAAQQPDQRQARARQLQHPARRVRLPADHGARRRPHRPTPTTRPTSRRPRTSSPRHGPSFGPERWEEQSGFSPSTIAAEIAGLIAAATIADLNGDHASARRLARRRRRVPAQPQEVDADDQRPAQRRSRTSSACRRPATRTRRSPTTSATAARRSTSARSSTPASSSTRGSACCRPTTPTSSRSLPVVDATIKRTHGQRRRLPALQRRRLRRRRDRRPPVGAVQQGQRPPVAGARRRARPVRARPRRRRAPRSRAWTRCATWAPASA